MHLQKLLKQHLLSACCLLLAGLCRGQGVGIGTTSPHASAQLDITSTSKGVLLPRVSTAQRIAIANPAFGLLVFDTDKGSFYLFDGENWKAMIFGNDADIPPITRVPVNGSYPFETSSESVAISGNFAMGGNPFTSNEIINFGDGGQGEVYVFSKTNNWTQTQLLQASDGASSTNNNFGFCIAMSGNLAVIGAPGTDIGANLRQGAAYVFSYTGGVWTQIQKLQAPGNTDGHFGFSVSTDGNTIAVGAPGNRAGGPGAGAVYTYIPNPLAGAGTPWILENTLTNAGGAAGDSLGTSVFLHNGWLVAGAPAANSGTGYACAYSQSGNNFVFAQVLLSPSPSAHSRFGASVCVNGNPYIFIGSPGAGIAGGNNGAIDSYQLSGNWTNIIGPGPNDYPFYGGGSFIGLSADGGTMITSYYEASTNLRILEGLYGTTFFLLKVSEYNLANLYPLASDGYWIVYTTDGGFAFKNVQ